jgi:hypothetical protein
VKQKLIFFLSLTFLLQNNIFAADETSNNSPKPTRNSIVRYLGNGVLLTITAAMLVDTFNTRSTTLEQNRLHDEHFLNNVSQKDIQARLETFQDCFNACVKHGNQHDNNRGRKEHCSKKCVKQALDKNNVPYGPHCWGNHRDYCFCGNGTCKSYIVEDVLKAQTDPLRLEHAACKKTYAQSLRKESRCAGQFNNSIEKIAHRR